MKWLKRLLFRIRNVANETPAEEAGMMLRLLLSRIDKINFYTLNVSMLESVEKNITVYTKMMRSFINYDLEKRYVVVKTIDMGNMDQYRFVEWYSNNGYAFSNNETMKKFLETAEEFLSYLNKKDDENIILDVNKTRLMPYKDNLENIISYLYKNT